MQFGHFCSIWKTTLFALIHCFSLAPFSNGLVCTINQLSCLFRQPLVVMTISIESSSNWKLSTWTACYEQHASLHTHTHTYHPIILQMDYEKFKLKSEIKLVKLTENLVNCFCWHHRWLLHLKLTIKSFERVQNLQLRVLTFPGV